MSAYELKNNVLPALLTGIRGRGMPHTFGATDSLQLLALASQAVKLDRPQPPETFIIEEDASDPRRIVPDEARPLIHRLVGAGTYVAAGGRTQAALARALADRGFKLHPFDLPVLESFVEKQVALLGAEALAFAQRDAAPEQRQSYFSSESMNDDNWTNGNRGERAKYIARRRAEDPDVALQLVEESWNSFDVEGKVRLAGALRVQSNPSDVPFLRTLLKERSPRIKDVARALLARLPGYDGDNPNLREALTRIEPRRTNPGSFDLRLPANVSHYDANEWIVSTFTGFGIEELARAKEMTVDQLVKSAVPGERLLCGLMVSATNDGRFDVIAEITERYLPTMQDFLIRYEIPGVEQLTAQERIEWLRAALRPRQWTDLSSHSLEIIYDILEGEMPLDIARSVFGAPVIRRMLQSYGYGQHGQFGIDHFELLAVMCPAELRAECRSMFAQNPHAESAILFLELLNTLENQNG
jgi:hypothetical protein